VDFLACDFSDKAIEWVRKASGYDPARIKTAVVDLAREALPAAFEPPDLVTLVFVLSAIAPELHLTVLNKVFGWMKEGAVLYFKDFGRYDFSQLNLSRKKRRKLNDNFYLKHDGTSCYFFEKEELDGLFRAAGFEVLASGALNRYVENRKTSLQMYRVWIQLRCRKPRALERGEGGAK